MAIVEPMDLMLVRHPDDVLIPSILRNDGAI
jgi:hypothetical protein